MASSVQTGHPANGRGWWSAGPGILAVIVLAVSGCAGSAPPDPAPVPSPVAPTGPADGGDAASQPCMVGQWTGVGMEMSIDLMAAAGGAGVTMNIDPAGQIVTDFDGMEPIEYTAGGPSPSAGHFVYTGTASGDLVLPPAEATSGEWEQVGEGAYQDVGFHMVITSPFELDLGPMNLGDLAGAEGDAGDVVDTEPVLSGEWHCAGDTLVSTSPEVDVTWTFTRTGTG